MAKKTNAMAQVLAELARLRRMVEERPEAAPGDEMIQAGRMEAEVTVLLPVFNGLLGLAPGSAAGALPRVLKALAPGNQSVPLNLIVCDNTSEDGTYEWLVSEPGRKVVESLFRGVIITDQIPHRPERDVNLAHAYTKMLELVESEYTFLLDADVLVAAGAIREMVDMFRRDRGGKIGALGSMYDIEAGHVQLGATMLRTAVAKKLVWRAGRAACLCAPMNEDLAKRGLKVMHLPEHAARRISPKDRPPEKHSIHLRNQGNS